MLRFSLNRASLGYVAGSGHLRPALRSATHCTSDLHCRRLSSAEATPDNKRNGTNKGSAYSHTLRLPKTDFPQRANAARREALFRQRCTADLYKWQLENNPGEVFVLHDGPPYANGSLHTGHFLNKTLKDFINRYQILRGKRVRYRPGWDCHGLPIELKALEVLKGREKDRLSPREVRSHARAFALRGVEEQKAEFMRWGIMGEWDSPYLTLDPAYEANQLRVFYAMFSKGLIYRKNKPVYWSPSSKTALAEAELEYNDSHVSSSVYVRVPLPSAELERLGVTEHGHRPAYVLVWTTTPWTLPANEAIAVHPDLLYHVILVEPATGEKAIYYVVGSDRLEALAERLNSGTPIRVVKTVKGRDLCGCRYWHPLRDGALMPILNAGHVTAGSGTGLVHSAPGHGKEDYELGVANSLPVFSPVDDNGCFTHEVGEERLVGKSVLGEGSAEVVRILEERGLLVALEKLVHSYPYDWRTKKPIIQRATPQWFANVQDIQRPVVEALGSTRVIPEAGRRRLQAFIMGRKEWCISRQRSWGVPIPALYEVETGEPLLSKESISHIIGVLEKNGGSDAWWELPAERFVAPQYASRRYRLGQDTMDVWFDSGASWASLNSGSDGQLRKTQADVYLEGSDQHRGWFQSSLLTSYATTGTVPYRTLITHGFSLDEHGRKMSKSLGNVIAPRQITDGGKDKKKEPAYGMDVLRLWVSSMDYSQDMSLGPTIIAHMAENMRKLRNTLRFILGNLSDFNSGSIISYERLAPIDRYLLHELVQFKRRTTEAYDAYAFYQVLREINQFTNMTLSALYFDVVKDTLYADHPSDSRRLAAQTTLYYVFVNYVTTLAPIMCHLAEEAYSFARDIVRPPSGRFSVFQEQWDQTDAMWDNQELASEWDTVLRIRDAVNHNIERARQDKAVGSSLEVDVELQVEPGPLHEKLVRVRKDLKEACIVSGMTIRPLLGADGRDHRHEGEVVYSRDLVLPLRRRGVGQSDEALQEDASAERCRVVIRTASKHKCPRCWVYASEGENKLCARCDSVVHRSQ